jgi:tetratricopeptide (TPR) repeat protein
MFSVRVRHPYGKVRAGAWLPLNLGKSANIGAGTRPVAADRSQVIAIDRDHSPTSAGPWAGRPDRVKRPESMNRLYLRAIAALPLVAVQLLAAPSHADPATAEALFTEGRRLLEAGQYPEACAKLAESQAQDPASGTLINLALCYEKQGKLATAWAHYRVAASLSRRDAKPDRAAAAEAKVQELEPLLSRLTIRARQRPPELELVWGELKLGAAALGSAIPVDAGAHELTVSARGYRPLSLLVAVEQGELQVVDLPPLTALPQPPSSAPAASPALGRVQPGDVLRPAPIPTGAIVVGGSGVALLGLGTYFGIGALSSYAAAQDLCPTHHACPDDALAARHSAEQRAWVANITIGAGVLATGSAVYLWLAGRREPRVSARMSLSEQGARLALHTRF